MINESLKPRVDLEVGENRVLDIMKKCRTALFHAGQRGNSMKLKSSMLGAQSIDEVYEIAQKYCKVYIAGVLM